MNALPTFEEFQRSVDRIDVFCRNKRVYRRDPKALQAFNFMSGGDFLYLYQPQPLSGVLGGQEDVVLVTKNKTVVVLAHTCSAQQAA